MLLKFFHNKGFADDFLGGKLYANRIKYYRGLEETQGGDRSEGITELFFKNSVMTFTNVKDGTTHIVGGKDNDISGPQTVIKSTKRDLLNVYCMHKVDAENTEEGIKFRIDRDLPERFGRYIVAITNTEFFFQQVDKIAKIATRRYVRGAVTYDEPTSFDEIFSIRAELYKRPEFSFEREYRFVFDIDTDNENPHCLEIGDIRDISICEYVSENILPNGGVVQGVQ